MSWIPVDPVPITPTRLPATSTPPAGTLQAPASVSFHWSDGHLDVTKKLNFTQDYQVSVEQSVTLEHGDALIVYSDGASEAINEAGDFFGDERIMAIAERANGGSANAIGEQIRSAVATFYARKDTATPVKANTA